VRHNPKTNSVFKGKDKLVASQFEVEVLELDLEKMTCKIVMVDPIVQVWIAFSIKEMDYGPNEHVASERSERAVRTPVGATTRYIRIVA